MRGSKPCTYCKRCIVVSIKTTMLNWLLVSSLLLSHQSVIGGAASAIAATVGRMTVVTALIASIMYAYRTVPATAMVVAMVVGAA